ncbi:MAG TPA: MauE/DoxX family redox-associated membrane protein [Polyangia bacterium]|nr:MauE/DoxX family redox-associated membrane protein [Polyangia bacterium]
MKRALEWILRFGLGALFVYAGWVKLRDPTAFATEVTNYHFFPSLAPYLAVTLPPAELVAGAGLIVLPREWRRAAALAVALLCAMFTVAVAQAVARHINVDCGCFGGASGPVTGVTVLRDLALLAGAIAIYALSPSGPPRARPA